MPRSCAERKREGRHELPRLERSQPGQRPALEQGIWSASGRPGEPPELALGAGALGVWQGGKTTREGRTNDGGAGSLPEETWGWTGLQEAERRDALCGTGEKHDGGCPHFVPASPRPWMILLKMGVPVFWVKQGPQSDILKS